MPKYYTDKESKVEPVEIRVELDDDDVNILADGNLIAWFTSDGTLFIAAVDSKLEALGFKRSTAGGIMLSGRVSTRRKGANFADTEVRF